MFSTIAKLRFTDSLWEHLSSREDTTIVAYKLFDVQPPALQRLGDRYDYHQLGVLPFTLPLVNKNSSRKNRPGQPTEGGLVLSSKLFYELEEPFRSASQ